MPKIVRFNEVGGPDKLQLVDEAPGAPGPSEVLVRVKAAGLNRSEFMYLHGQYLVEPVLPSRIGQEGAGVIEQLGAGVQGFSVGDEVSITPNMSPAEHGVIGEWTIVPAKALVPKAPDISFEEASAIWMAYPTAYGGLVEFGGLREGAGQTVVISAASSGIGRPAIQIAKAHGATVIATSRTSAKKAGIMEAGADHFIATNEEDFVARVMEITGGRGFHIAFDPIAGPFLNTLAEAAAREATIVEYGALSMAETPFPLFAAVDRGLHVCGFHLVWNLFDYPERNARAIAHIQEKQGQGAYTPVIDKVFPLERVADAYEYMAGGRQVGKIIVSTVA